MCRDSSDCAEKPKVIVGRSPLKDDPDMKGTKSRLVSRYSKEKPIAMRNSKGPQDSASSMKLLGTDRYQTRSYCSGQLCRPE